MRASRLGLAFLSVGLVLGCTKSLQQMDCIRRDGTPVSFRMEKGKCTVTERGQSVSSEIGVCEAAVSKLIGEERGCISR